MTMLIKVKHSLEKNPIFENINCEYYKTQAVMH